MALTDEQEKELKERLAKAEKGLEEAQAAVKTAQGESVAAKQQAQQMVNKAKEYIVKVTSQLAQRGRQEVPKETEEDPETFAKLLQEDPEGALDEHFAKRMGPLLAKQNEVDTANARDQVRKELSSKSWYSKGEKGEDLTFLDIYGDSLDKFMEGMPANLRADPQQWKRAVDFVRTQNLDAERDAAVQAKLAEKEADSAKGILVEGPTPPGGRGTPARARLDSTELALMKEFDMDEKEWLEYGGGDDGARLGEAAEEII